MKLSRVKKADRNDGINHSIAGSANQMMHNAPIDLDHGSFNQITNDRCDPSRQPPRSFNS
jgi:hypothetical protein